MFFTKGVREAGRSWREAGCAYEYDDPATRDIPKAIHG
jgi:hypothetical protein